MEEERNYAKEINAIFKVISAKDESEVKELFKFIGLKFLDPNYNEEELSKNKCYIY